MRIIIISISSVLCLLFSMLTQTVINSRSLREAELQDAIGTSVSQTLEEVMSESYGIETDEEMVAALLQGILVKINSDIELTVDIIQMDRKEGLLDVRVSAQYQDVGEQKRVIEVRRTALYDVEEEDG